MEELKQILLAHAGRYPLMEPTDAVKLIYQNEFGCGHFVRDEAAALAYLRREYAQTEKGGQPMYEPIGNGFFRVNLAAVEENELERLGREFIRSARIQKGSRETFAQKLEVLKELTAQGIFGFDSVALEDYLKSYREAGYPAVSHSPTYREAYRPAYRVICREGEGTLLQNVCRILDGCLEEGSRKIVAIDGRCASGKSTLADALGAKYGCPVIHMDHFFLQPHQRTAERLRIPGENIDHERFLQEVLLPLREGKPCAYRPFDCGTGNLGEPIHMEDGSLILVEGSYACHRALREHYDLRLFVTVEPKEQMERILCRNGAEMAELFRSRWIPLEEAYFDASDLPNRADHCFDTSR